MDLLLSDEKIVSEEDLKIRQELYELFNTLPITFLSKMRHLQPQIGCFNNCSFCSKFSVCKSEYWSERTLKNIICALKKTAQKYTKDDVLLAWDRQEHRVGVIFPYLDNDIASYKHLDKYLELCYKELGVRTRISTVGFSRHNEELNNMHKRICESNLMYTLAGVRLSLTQYGKVWEDKKGNNSLDEYIEDISNFLKIYKSYYDNFGSGYRKMCVELRFNPLVVNSDIFIFELNNKKVISTSNYLYISKDENIEFEETYVTDPYNHSLTLSNNGIKFIEYNLPFKVENKEQLIEYIENEELKEEKEVEVYLFTNRDGEYYSIDPKLTPTGNYGINIYPKTENRKQSGYIVTERFFLNSLYNFKAKRSLTLKEKYEKATYEDFKEVIDIFNEYVKYYEEIGKLEKSEYIKINVIPLIDVYMKALIKSGYQASLLFDKDFTIDTGMICNLGRAINLFKGITSFVNEPLTPVHERNYGRHCSTMKEENYVWLLGCDFNDNLLIERLDLFNTASTQGQVSYKNRIKFEGFNEKTNETEKHLFPGELI